MDLKNHMKCLRNTLVIRGENVYIFCSYTYNIDNNIVCGNKEKEKIFNYYFSNLYNAYNSIFFISYTYL